MVARVLAEKIVDPSSLRSCRATHSQTRVYRLQSARGMRIEFEVGALSRDTVPEVAIGLIPDFEIPLRDLVDASRLFA
jgi:hypothetical protein